MREAFCTALGVIALSGFPVAIAQETELSYGDAVEVNVVSVDVVVTDADGRPALGLDRDDFILIEDGERVELTNFFAARGTTEIPLSSEVSEPVPTPTVEDAVEPVHVVLYFDNTTLVQAHRNRVLEDVQGFVEELGGNARFLVVTFDPGLHLVTPFTSDPATVRAAIDQIAEMPAKGLEAIRARTSTRDAMGAIWQNWEVSKGYGPLDGSGEKRGASSGLGRRGRFFDPCVEAWPEMLNMVENYALSEVHRVRSAQNGLVSLTRALVGVPGRKYVLYMSDGLELVPAMAEYEMLGELCPERVRELFGHYSQYDQTGSFEELTALANANRVSFYALDTTGLTGASLASASIDDRRFAPSPRTDTTRRENLRGSLFTMADQTAGRAFFNANRPAAELAEMTQDISNFYSLGFSPEHGWDGKVHKIRVRLSDRVDKGYELRYRSRYRALPEAERVAERTLTALVLGANDNPLGVSVAPERPTAIGNGRFRVPLTISLPIERLTLLPGSAASRGEVRVVVAVAVPEESRNSLHEKVVQIEIPKRSALGDHALTIHLRLSPGVHTIGLGVEDRLGRLASYLRQEIEVAPGTG